MPEQRRHPRAPAPFLVRYQKSSTVIEVEAANISAGGVLVHTPAPLPLGTVFRLELVGPEQWSLRGEVIWLTAPEGAGLAELGIAFMWNHADDAERLQRCLGGLGQGNE